MPTPQWYRRELSLGDSGPDVDAVRRKLLLEPGTYDQTLHAIVKGLGVRFGERQDGVLDQHIAQILGDTEVNKAGLVPDWYTQHDKIELARILGVLHERSLVDAVKRWQGNHEYPPTGILDPDQARMIGE